MTVEIITRLQDKFSDASEGELLTAVIAATGLFMANLIKDQDDLSLDKKLQLVDELSVSIKRYVRGLG